MAKKVEVDLNELGMVINQTNPAQQRAVVKAARTARLTSGSYEDRLRQTSILSLDDIENRLEYEVGEDGQPVSKIPEGIRLQYNLNLLKLNPDLLKMTRQAGPAMPTINVQLDNRQLIVAQETAKQIADRRAKQIEGEVEAGRTTALDRPDPRTTAG